MFYEAGKNSKNSWKQCLRNVVWCRSLHVLGICVTNTVDIQLYYVRETWPWQIDKQWENWKRLRRFHFISPKRSLWNKLNSMTQLTRNKDNALPNTAVKRSLAEFFCTMKKSARNRYSRQLLSSKAKCMLRNRLSKECCKKKRLTNSSKYSPSSWVKFKQLRYISPEINWR